jgi:hypothetical protein
MDFSFFRSKNALRKKRLKIQIIIFCNLILEFFAKSKSALRSSLNLCICRRESQSCWLRISMFKSQRSTYHSTVQNILKLWVSFFKMSCYRSSVNPSAEPARGEILRPRGGNFSQTIVFRYEEIWDIHIVYETLEKWSCFFLKNI